MHTKLVSHVTLMFVLTATSVLALGCVQQAGEPDETLNAEPAAASDESVGTAVQALTTSCTLGPDCPSNGPIALQSNIGGQMVARIDMGANLYRRMDVFSRVCNPVGWVLHVTDSPTANGYGGDSSTTDHDAEGYLLGTTFQFFSAFDMRRMVAGTFVEKTSAFTAGTGCYDVHAVVYNTWAGTMGSPTSYFSFQGSPTPSTQVTSLHGMKLGYTACTSTLSDPRRAIECDLEDSTLADQNFWYVGVNRVVGGGRTGTGAGSTCIVLNSDVNATVSSCLPSQLQSYSKDALE